MLDAPVRGVCPPFYRPDAQHRGRLSLDNPTGCLADIALTIGGGGHNLREPRNTLAPKPHT